MVFYFIKFIRQIESVEMTPTASGGFDLIQGGVRIFIDVTLGIGSVRKRDADAQRDRRQAVL